MPRAIALLDAPSNLGLAPPAPGKEPGVRRMADGPRGFGLRERLGAVDAGRVVAPEYSPNRDAATGIRNAHEIADYSRALARAVGEQLDADRFPLVLGGDCSILLGSMLELHHRGRYGLVFIDGHEDLQTPGVSRTGGAAGMDLALAVGIGPRILSALGNAPLVRPEDVSLVGPRDDPASYVGEDVTRARDAMGMLLLDDVRRMGAASAGASVARRIARPALSGAWIHLDVDVLDDEVMPAVDSRQPGGLSYDDLDALLGPIFQTGRIAGMQVTIYDPDRDADGVAGRTLADFLVRLFGPQRRA